MRTYIDPGCQQELNSLINAFECLFCIRMGFERFYNQMLKDETIEALSSLLFIEKYIEMGRQTELTIFKEITSYFNFMGQIFALCLSDHFQMVTQNGNAAASILLASILPRLITFCCNASLIATRIRTSFDLALSNARNLNEAKRNECATEFHRGLGLRFDHMREAFPEIWATSNKSWIDQRLKEFRSNLLNYDYPYDEKYNTSFKQLWFSFNRKTIKWEELVRSVHSNPTVQK
eukprot:TRINITY_DN8866_c0_g1_i1.p1 TRINITY_DN8866_c0_g1~~TRINITY_DN8866_c0_g1_i1.p1  ORF type:complete len:234 (+),score=37.08 TRINITY_DN8866_c0_g1_i1:85-786(+)